MNSHPISRWYARCLCAAMLATPTSLLAQDAAPAPEDEEFFVFDEEETDGAPALAISDPLEGLNRVTFSFNDKLYRGVLKPIARGLRVLPEPVRVSGVNFFDNLGAPVSSISALLQGDLRNSINELGRFLLNSTAGIAGLFDVATDVGLTQDEEDLGQTLGRYGIGHGFYLVLPFYGSSSLRDTIGTAGTTAINPIYQNLEPGEVLGITFTEAELALSVDKDTYEGLYEGALDPYAFFRSAWLQNRAGKVQH
jgi:phospholipid-binding lipoprotein MlaA